MFCFLGGGYKNLMKMWENSPCDFTVASFTFRPAGKHSCGELGRKRSTIESSPLLNRLAALHMFLGCCFLVHAQLFTCSHNLPTSDMDFGIFSMCVFSFCMHIHAAVVLYIYMLNI